MIRQSNKSRLVKNLSSLIPAAQVETHRVDEAAAARLAINRTDLRCLGEVIEDGAPTAGTLAEKIGLTRGAMTTVLDRLERAGYVRRFVDRDDRRSIVVEATPKARKMVKAIWEPIGADGLATLEKFSDAELATLNRFFEAYCDLQRRHAARIRGMK